MTRTRVEIDVTPECGPIVNVPATGAGFSSITSVSDCSVRLSSPAKLTRMPIGTTAASSARRGASRTTRPEPSRMGRSLKISPLMLFQVSSEGWSEAAARCCARAPPAAPARQSAAIRAGTITLEKIDMVEFRFHHETAANLSEKRHRQAAASPAPGAHSHSSSPNAAMTLREPYSSNSFHRDCSLRPASLAALVRGVSLGDQAAHFAGKLSK